MKNLIYRLFPYIVILGFIYLSFIRILSFWSPERSFVSADTGIYALHLTGLANNLFHIFDQKNSMFLWNPYYYFVGLPTLAAIDSGLLYPINWIVALLARLSGDTLNAIPIYVAFIFIHLTVSTVFVYKILRDIFKVKSEYALVGSLLWPFLGYNAEFIVSAPVVMAGCYLPICFYVMMRWIHTNSLKYFFLFFILLAFSFSIGYPFVSILVYVVCAFVHLGNDSIVSRIKIRKFLLFHVLGILLITFPLIAPQYFAAIMNFGYSVRSAITHAQFYNNAVSPLNLAESILPRNNLFNQSSSVPVYLYFSLVGIVILLSSGDLWKTILREKTYIALLALGCIGLILSLGNVTALPDVIYFLMPGINLFRRLSIFSILPGFVFCIFVTLGIRSMAEGRPSSSFLGFVAKAAFIIVIIAQIMVILKFNTIFPQLQIDSLVQSMLTVVIVGGLTVAAAFAFHKNEKLALSILVLALLIEAGTQIGSKSSLNIKTDPNLFYKKNVLIQYLQQTVLPGERIDMGVSQNVYNTEYIGLEQRAGYLSLPSVYSSGINTALTSPGYSSSTLQNLLGLKYKVEYLDLATGKIGPSDFQIEVPPIEKGRPEFYRIGTGGIFPEAAGTKYVVRRYNDALPRIFLATTVKDHEQTEDVLKLIADDPKKVYVDPSQMQEVSNKKIDTVEIEEYKRNYIRGKVNTAEGGFLVNTTSFYPGWDVIVNGEVKKPIRTNWFMMGVYVPPGESTVVFKYTSPGFFIGLFYLSLAVLLWLVIFITGRKKSSYIHRALHE